MSADTIVPGYANPQNLNRYSYVTNNPLRYTDPTGHSCTEEDANGNIIHVNCGTGLPPNSGGGGNGSGGGSHDDDDDPGGGGDHPLLSPISDDDPPPVSPTICAGPMWGNPPSCVLDIIPDIEITVGLKPWEDIDKIDLAVDVLGIVGDIASVAGGPPGVIFWLFITEIPEFMTMGRAYDQMETGDPAGGVSVIVDTVIPIAQAVRLLPAGGWVGNVVGIGLNIFEIQVEVVP